MSSRGGTRAGGSRAVRRRRLTALVIAAAVLGALVAGLAAAIAPLEGSSRRSALGGPGGVPTVLAVPTPAAVHGSPSVHRASSVDVPAAIRQVRAMPLERLVAQIFAVGLPGTAVGSSGEVAGPGWGAVVFGAGNFVGDAAAASYSAAASAAIRGTGAPPPLLIADQAGGDGTALPDLPPRPQSEIAGVPAAAAARAAQGQALAAARALARLGFSASFAPNLDVAAPNATLGGGVYGDIPDGVGRLGRAALAGYARARVVAIPGHFPGQGDASGDPDLTTATVGGTLTDLRARAIVPFAAALAAAPAVRMSNALYAALDGVTPASLSSKAVRLLREELGYRGVIVSGDLDAALQATGGTIGQAAVAALHAGDDLLFLTGSPAEEMGAYMAVLDAARRSAAERARVRAAAIRVLDLKARARLLA